MKENSFWWTDEMIDRDATKIMSIIDRLVMLKKLTTNKRALNFIDKHITNLKSNSPVFDKAAAEIFNRKYRKIKN